MKNKYRVTFINDCNEQYTMRGFKLREDEDTIYLEVDGYEVEIFKDEIIGIAELHYSK